MDQGVAPMEVGDDASPDTPNDTPFSGAVDTSFARGSAPDLTNHPHLDNSMRSLSSSVAARRKVRPDRSQIASHNSLSQV